MDAEAVKLLQEKYPYVDSALILALAGDGTDEIHPNEELETLLTQLNEDARILDSLGETEVSSAKEKQEIEAVLKELQQQEDKEDDSMSKINSLGSFGSLSSDLDTLSLDESIDENLKQNIAFLRQSFPSLPLATIRAKLLGTRGDVTRATDLLLNSEILDQIESDAHYVSYGKKRVRIRNRDKKTTHDNVQLQVLSELLGITIEEAAEKYEDNDKSVAKVLALDNAANGTAGSMSNAWKESLPLAPSSLASSRSNLSPVYASRLGQPSTISATATGVPSRPLSAPVGVRNGQQLSNLATQEYELGQDSFSKAREMYRRGKSNPLYGGAATYYSETGQGHMQMYRAAQESVEHQSLQRQSSPYIMDFHGVSAKVAAEACAAKLEDWWTRENRGAGRVTPLKLVTGAGRHSDGGVPKIKNAIRKILKDNGWRFEEDGSFFLVKGVK
jgi:hypothetical protein